jgi:hypothetical protein
MGKPTNFKELFAFYYREFKPIYAELSTSNDVPVEMLHEVNAAFDHLSRAWKYDEPEDKVVDRTLGHLKRACFDAFKLVLSRTSDMHERLLRVDTAIIDNGTFDQRLHRDWAELQARAVEARSKEGNSRDVNVDAWHEAFERWNDVYVRCKNFEREFFLNPHVGWAKKRQGRRTWLRRGEGFLLGVVTSLVAALIWSWASPRVGAVTQSNSNPPSTTGATPSAAPVTAPLSAPAAATTVAPPAGARPVLPVTTQ